MKTKKRLKTLEDRIDELTVAWVTQLETLRASIRYLAKATGHNTTTFKDLGNSYPDIDHSTNPFLQDKGLREDAAKHVTVKTYDRFGRVIYPKVSVKPEEPLC